MKKSSAILAGIRSFPTIVQGKTRVLSLVKKGEKRLRLAGLGENPRLESEILLSSVLNCSRLDLYLRYDEEAGSAVEGRFEALLERRGRHEPLQYLTGRQTFLNREFQVGPGVLIPRPETEGLVLEAVSHLEKGPLADLGTGSGCIALSILLEIKREILCYGIDVSGEALNYARENARRHGLAHRIHLFQGDLFNPLPEYLKHSFEMIVSNPPYLDMERDELDPEIREYEPRTALDGGSGGLNYYAQIFKEAGSWLKPGGFLILEIGFNQGDSVWALSKRHSSFSRVRSARDEQGIDRVLTFVYEGLSHIG